LVAGAVRGQQQWRSHWGRSRCGWFHEAESSPGEPAGFLATRSNALNAATATAEPPFSETLLKAGRPLARR